MNPATKWILNQFKSSGLTQQKFAEKCGVCMLQIGRWERGEQDPYPVSIRKVGAAFGIAPPEEVLQAAEEARRSRYIKKRHNPSIAEQKEISGPNKRKRRPPVFNTTEASEILQKR